MEKKRKKILVSDERCAGCQLCVLSCSLANFGAFNPVKSLIKLDRDDRNTRFALSIGDGCKSCGECIRACAYDALRWEDEAPRH
jgi:ferredoxin